MEEKERKKYWQFWQENQSRDGQKLAMTNNLARWKRIDMKRKEGDYGLWRRYFWFPIKKINQDHPAWRTVPNSEPLHEYQIWKEERDLCRSFMGWQDQPHGFTNQMKFSKGESQNLTTKTWSRERTACVWLMLEQSTFQPEVNKQKRNSAKRAHGGTFTPERHGTGDLWFITLQQIVLLSYWGKNQDGQGMSGFPKTSVQSSFRFPETCSLEADSARTLQDLLSVIICVWLRFNAYLIAGCQSGKDIHLKYTRIQDLYFGGITFHRPGIPGFLHFGETSFYLW